MVNTEELKADAAGNAQASARTSVRRRFARRGWGAALVAALSLVVSLMSTTPASAYVGENLLRNWENGWCLTVVTGGSVHARLDCDSGNRNEIWQPIYIGHSSYDIVTLKNQGTGSCLSVEDGDYLGHPACSTSSIHQQFRAEGENWNNVRLVSLFSGSCLEGSSPYVYMKACSSPPVRQQWRLGY